jgi:hypothetical protein
MPGSKPRDQSNQEISFSLISFASPSTSTAKLKSVQLGANQLIIDYCPLNEEATARPSMTAGQSDFWFMLFYHLAWYGGMNVESPAAIRCSQAVKVDISLRTHPIRTL